MTGRLLGEAIRQRLDELGLSGNQLAERVPYDPGGMSRIIAGTRGCQPETAAAIDRALDAGGKIIEAAAMDAKFGDAAAEAARTRRALDEALARGMMTEGVLDSWEAAVDDITHRAWGIAAPVLVRDLTGMLRDLKLAIARHRSASALPRLVRAVAITSSVMTLAMVRAGDQSWQGWAATARAAALEAGDQKVLAAATTAEATGHFAVDRFPSALQAAQHALCATGAACGGTAMAADLEMRILARTRDVAGAWSAFRAAERLTEQLGDEPGEVYPLGRMPALWAFHRGDFLLHVGDRAAERELDLAVELSRRDDDYSLWAASRLRKAACVVRSGDLDSGLALAGTTFAALASDEAHGFVTTLARDLLSTLSPAQRETRAARDFQALIGLPVPAGI